jgi:hypothetical protein
LAVGPRGDEEVCPVSKIDAMQEIYLLYQVISSHLMEGENPGGCGMTELNAYYRSFCQREPIGGMFLESVLEELMDQVRKGKAV